MNTSKVNGDVEDVKSSITQRIMDFLKFIFRGKK